jgi:hypothetical protein
MLQDLAALAPPLIVCAAFLFGVGFLVRREMAPRRRGGGAGERGGGRADAPGEDDRSGVVAGEGEPDARERGRTSET